MKIKILCLILVCLVSGCVGAINLPGSGSSLKTVKKATAEVIQETEIKTDNTGQMTGEISLVLNDQLVTGTIKAEFEGTSEGKLSAPDRLKDKSSDGYGKSMVLSLFNLFQYMFILIILITWVATKWLGGLLKKMAKRSISLIVAGIIIFGYVLFSGYNSFDLICVGILAWGVSNYIYDLTIKKGYKELIGLKNK